MTEHGLPRKQWASRLTQQEMILTITSLEAEQDIIQLCEKKTTAMPTTMTTESTIVVVVDFVGRLLPLAPVIGDATALDVAGENILAFVVFPLYTSYPFLLLSPPEIQKKICVL